jgi:lipoprotein-anchoring transpeptidase ErfK/SrfK
MKRKSIFIINIFVYLTHILIIPVAADNVIQKYHKIILINQHNQVGVAYEDREKVREFPVLSGDDETTHPGTYTVKMKDDSYYSRKYQTWMPYSIFFDLKNRRAIHEGYVGPPEERKMYATPGCIHVESPYIEWLFDWADEGTTAVVIQGWRDED